MPQIPAEYRVLEGSGRKPPTGAQRSSLADPGEVLTVSVRVRRRPDALALPDPDNRVATALNRLQCVSREDFAGLYGARPSDLDLMAQFGRQNGLDVVESSIRFRSTCH